MRRVQKKMRGYLVLLKQMGDLMEIGQEILKIKNMPMVINDMQLN
jgi:hypothetical protein